MGVSGAPNTGSPRSKPFPMEPVAEPYAMRRLRERLAPDYPVVANTTARNSRTYDGRPACCGNNSCQPICPIDAQYHGGIAADAAEAAGAKLIANANVYQLEHDAQGRIAAALITTPTRPRIGSPARPSSSPPTASKARACCCCRPATSIPKGLANSSDMVGRNLMDHPSTSLTFDADEELWLGRGPQSPSSINTMRDGAFRSEHAPYRLDFTNISRVDGATQTPDRGGRLRRRTGKAAALQRGARDEREERAGSAAATPSTASR